MRIFRLVKMFLLMGALVFMIVPSVVAAGCPACSGIGQSTGYYGNPTIYGGYGPGYGYPSQMQIQPVKPKQAKSKKRSPKPKPEAK